MRKIWGRGMEGAFLARPGHPRVVRVPVLAADLDDLRRKFVGVEVEVVPLDRAQDLLGQRSSPLALEDEGEVHDE